MPFENEQRKPNSELQIANNEQRFLMSRSPLYLITGYLGSGKTTFIKQLIVTYSGKETLAVIQNEFAPANIDGQDLKRHTSQHFELLEVNNGSVFCVCLLSGFVKSLKSFVDQHNPGIIFMEASGLSDPISIGQIFSAPELKDSVYLAGVICLVDAVNFIKIQSTMPRIAHQIMIADYILINKTDLPCNLSEIESSIHKINPLAQKFQTVQSNVPFDTIFLNSTGKEQITPKRFFFLQADTNRPDIQSVVLKTVKPIKAENVNRFVHQLSELCYRMKGTIVLDDGSLISVQLVSGDFRVEIINSPQKQTELIAIGKEITPKMIKTLYDEACKGF